VNTRALPLAVAALIALEMLTGCRTFVPFTQELRDQNRLTDAELQNLQFYVSSNIVLRREADSAGRQVTGNHRLVVVAGKTIEEVLVESKTPGICVGTGPHTLSISFEPGSSIEFTPAARGYAAPRSGFAVPPDPEPFPGNFGRQSASSRDLFAGGYRVWVGPQNTVSFLGRAWDAIDETPEASLLIDAESLNRVVKQHKVLPGLRLPNG
jgi:hypothetical protein